MILTHLLSFAIYSESGGDDTSWPELVLPLDEAKRHLNVLDDSFDDLISDLRDEAIDWVERYCSVSLYLREFQWVQDRFTSSIKLPIGPLGEVTAISYYDSAGTDTALAEGDWYIGRGSIVAMPGTAWPSDDGRPGGVRVTFTAGYAHASEIPGMLLSAVKVAIAAMFANREQPDFAGAMRCCDRVRVPAL